MKKSELRQLIKEELMNEASEVNVTDLPEDIQKFLKKHRIEKNVESAWSGINGNIVRFQTDTVRLDKKDLVELIKNPHFRWIDPKSIGA